MIYSPIFARMFSNVVAPTTQSPSQDLEATFSQAVATENVYNAEQALKALQSNKLATASHYSKVMKLYKKSQKKKVKPLFEQMKLAGIEANTNCYCQVIHAVAEAGNSVEGLSLIDEMRLKGLEWVEGYADLVNGLMKSNAHQAGLAAFDKYRQLPGANHPGAYNQVIRYYGSVMKDLKMCLRLLEELKERQGVLTVWMYLHIIECAAATGDVKVIDRLAKEAVQRTEEDAPRLLAQLLERDHPPSAGFADQIIRENSTRNPQFHAVLIGAYLRCQSLERAKKAFNAYLQQQPNWSELQLQHQAHLLDYFAFTSDTSRGQPLLEAMLKNATSKNVAPPARQGLVRTLDRYAALLWKQKQSVNIVNLAESITQLRYMVPKPANDMPTLLQALDWVASQAHRQPDQALLDKVKTLQEKLMQEEAVAPPSPPPARRPPRSPRY